MQTRIDALTCSILTSGEVTVCLCVLHPDVVAADLGLDILREGIPQLQEQFPNRVLRIVLPRFTSSGVEFLELDVEYLLARGDGVVTCEVADDDLIVALHTACRGNENYQAFQEALQRGARPMINAANTLQ